jgi:hypothetical protein
VLRVSHEIIRWVPVDITRSKTPDLATDLRHAGSPCQELRLADCNQSESHNNGFHAKTVGRRGSPRSSLGSLCLPCKSDGFAWPTLLQLQTHAYPHLLTLAPAHLQKLITAVNTSQQTGNSRLSYTAVSQSDIPSITVARTVAMEIESLKVPLNWITHIPVYISGSKDRCYMSSVLPIRPLSLQCHTCFYH